jgi:hypothetical protein
MSNIKVKIMFVCNFYECETWLLTLREDGRLRVFENRVLRRIFGLKRDEVGKQWKILHTKAFCLYSSTNIIGVIKSRIMR